MYIVICTFYEQGKCIHTYIHGLWSHPFNQTIYNEPNLTKKDAYLLSFHDHRKPALSCINLCAMCLCVHCMYVCPFVCLCMQACVCVCVCIPFTVEGKSVVVASLPVLERDCLSRPSLPLSRSYHMPPPPTPLSHTYATELSLCCIILCLFFKCVVYCVCVCVCVRERVSDRERERERECV